MTHPEIEKRVAAGAKLLDEKHPGWRAKIKPAMLNMRSCQYCVLGQLLGMFGERSSVELLVGPVEHVNNQFLVACVQHGFGIGLGEHYPEGCTKPRECFDALQAEWLRVLAPAA